MSDLNRFLKAQNDAYENALSELRSGKKNSHWMWFIFPQIKGLGRSSTSEYYGIENAEEAKAYLANSILGARLLECTKAVIDIPRRSAKDFFRKRAAKDIFGSTDELKLKSSMTLFSLVAPHEPSFRLVLDKYFDGEKDTRTIELLSR